MSTIEVKLENLFDLRLELNLWLLLAFVLLLCALIIILHFIRRGSLSRTIEFDGTDIGIGPHTVKFKANIEDLKICYKLWVEMSTRKIGLPIEIENDVIAEVYNSWYAFFGIARDLIKSIPVTKILRNDSTRELVRISIDVLNMGLRPHLTSWQAKFRKWYDEEIGKTENAQLSPQEVQKKYPKYPDLIKDLIKINQQLVSYKEKLADLLR